MKRKIAAGAITGAVIAAGALFASPADAYVLQNGCQGTSFKLYSSTTGYCFNMVDGPGYSADFSVWALSYQSDEYAGDVQVYGLSGWVWESFGYQQSGNLNGSTGIEVDQVYLGSVD